MGIWVRMSRFPLLVVLVLAVSAPGCGDDDGGGNGSTSNALRDAVAKTEAAGTARMTFTVSVSGGASERFSGEALIDFEHDRNRLTMEVEGQTVELFADGDDEYFRVGSSGRYRSEFPDKLRGYQAPVLVCVNGAGRIRRYDVELSLQGTTVKTATSMSDHGDVAPLEPLGPAELQD
jgi:hypothetical protein